MNDLSIAASEDAFSYYDPRICVIGLGHIGIHHAMLFSEKYKTIGYDFDQARTDKLMHGHGSTSRVSDKLLKQAIKNGLFCTSDVEKIRKCNFYVIIVPPICVERNESDLRILWDASEIVGKVLSGGDIVVYDFCVGTTITENDCISIIEQVSGLTCNFNFFAGYSPGPDNFEVKGFSSWGIGKFTSGSTPEITRIVDEVYTSVFTVDTLNNKATETVIAEK